MNDRANQPSLYTRAWWGIFVVTLAATGFGGLVIFAIAQSNIRDIPASAIRIVLSMGAIAVPASAVGATICARIIRLRPMKQTLPMFFLLVAVVVFLGIPAVFLFRPAPLFAMPVMVIGAQLVASGIAMSVKALEQPDACGNCTYSLAGLDRAKTSVCPECGEALPPTTAR